MPDREKKNRGIDVVKQGLEYCKRGWLCPSECPYYSPNPEDADETCPMFDDALALLKEQGWIPVTERLPELRHAVLCYSPHHKNIWALSLHEDGEWYYWIPMYEKYNPDFEGPITHWMALPEPPKEGR